MHNKDKCNSGMHACNVVANTSMRIFYFRGRSGSGLVRLAIWLISTELWLGVVFQKMITPCSSDLAQGGGYDDAVSLFVR